MITIENVNFHYKKSKPLFVSLNAELEKGKIYGLLGKNGSGKTSLLRLLNGLLNPVSGSIKISDFNAVDRDVNMLQKIYYVQEEYKMPDFKIELFKKLNAPFYPQFDENKFYSLLESFEIDKENKLKDLSYGQRKKVHLSFALSTNVEFLILDEPTNGLDIPSKSQLRKALINGMGEEQTVFISTHQVRDLNQLIDHIILLNEGEIIVNKSIGEISETFKFNHVSGNTIPEKAIYAEMVAGGHMVVLKNDSQLPSEVDLEIFFNAAVQNQNLFTEVLNN